MIGSDMPHSPRIVMLGTKDFALPTFEHLCEAGLDVVGLVTQPDRPQGRKQLLIPSRIKEAALARGIRVEQPEDVNEAGSLDMIRSFAPDLLVTAAYGQILSADLLTIPSMGGINLHGSILPAYRGAAPVARAIQRGETETGVTVIRMTPRIDAGGMMAFARTSIDPDETAGEVEARLATLGAPLVGRAIAELVAGTAQILTQARAKVTRAPKLQKSDGLIDWTRSSVEIHNQIRAMQPWPIASTAWSGPQGSSRLIVHQAASVEGSGDPGTVIEASRDRLVIAAGSGAVRLLRVQLEGKKVLLAEEFLRGHSLQGARLGT